ncbi:MAG: glutathione synthase [Endozoicomonadaceae bacterium]|nr:glutathione synthase [Endozoicomonadaceae bacterium]
MSTHLAIIMDNIRTIHVEKDSSLRLLLAAQNKKWHIYYMEPSDIFYDNGLVMGRITPIQVTLNAQNWYHLSSPIIQPIQSLDVILMRQEPPCHSEYIYTTYLLELAEKAGVFVFNKPSSLRNFNEKFFITAFPKCIPATLITRRIEQLNAFIDQEKKVVLKPLDGMGGRSIFRVTHDDLNRSVILEQITQYGTQTIMAQRFIPEIQAGDKRVLMINGQALPYALVRKPKANDFRGNLAAGSSHSGQPLSQKDQWIAKQVGPTLKKQGLLFVGLDIIGDYLTEINITSPTCIAELDQAFHLDIATLVLDKIEQSIQKTSSS